jgi:predicted metalloprotease with PDZ domain
LRHSGVFSAEEYLKELTATCIRHFTKNSTAKQSLVEASIDLWLDGYSTGIPDKKVSIYYKGAVVALILDLMIRLKHNHKKNLYTVMKMMWQNFGKPLIGYDILDFKNVAESVFGENLDNYFEEYIFGNIDLKPILDNYLTQIGLEISFVNSDTLTIEILENRNERQKYNFDKFLNN